MEFKFQVGKIPFSAIRTQFSPAVNGKDAIDFSGKDSATDAQWSVCLTRPMLR